jgi:hypothetical protein
MKKSVDAGIFAMSMPRNSVACDMTTEKIRPGANAKDSPSELLLQAKNSVERVLDWHFRRGEPIPIRTCHACQRLRDPDAEDWVAEEFLANLVKHDSRKE